MYGVLVKLLHETDDDHLAKVKAEMMELGAPKINVLPDTPEGCDFIAYVALEGTHRLTAAYELGLVPTLIDCSKLDKVIVQIDGYDEELTIDEAIEWASDANGHTIDFDCAEEVWGQR